MATGGMSWQYHNQKHFPSYGLPGSSDGSGADVQEMHLKMSKKIAQLTKVIYALNTKNDEHEAAMSALKDAHEEEMQQMLTETAAKIQQYRLKIGDELDLRRRIKNLEDCVGAFEREKKQALVEIDAHKRISAEREVNREREHEDKIKFMTRELEETKAAFLQRINDFESIVSNLEREKAKNMDSVTMDYKRQMEALRVQLDEQKKNWMIEKEELTNSHTIQAQTFEREISNLKEEIKKTIDDSEAKMEKAKSFYEHELAVLRSSSLSDDEVAMKWQQRENVLKEEFSKVETNLQKKIRELSNELDIQHEEVTHLQQQLKQSKSEATSTTDHVKDLRDQLSKLHQDYSASVDRVKYLEDELGASKSRAESQAADILRKSSIIGTLEAIKLTQEESIHDLEAQMKEIRRKYQELEAEKSALQNSQSDENGQLLQQLQTMSKRIESLNKEKSALQKQFKRDLEEMKISHEEELENLKQQFEKEANSMSKSREAEVTLMKSEAQEAMDKLLQEMQERVLREAAQFENDQAAAVAKVEAEKEILQRNLQQSQNEITRLRSLIEAHESGLGDASSHITSLKTRIDELEDEVKSSEARNNSKEATILELRTEFKGQAEIHNEQLSKLDHEHQEALEKNKREMDERWEERMRLKLEELQSRLSAHYLEERQRALSDLERVKDRELEASKAGWEDQIRQLTNQMSEMRQSFEAERREFERQMEVSKTDMTQAERKLRNEAQQAAADYSDKIDHLVESHKMALLALEQRKEDEMKSQESRLLSQHREEMHSQLRAQQIAIESVREKMKREKLEEFEMRESEFQQDMDELKSELSHQHASTLDDVTRQYETHLQTLKLELSQTLESKRRNEEKLNQKMEDLETDLRMSSVEGSKLRDKVTQQNEMMSTLNKELEQKGQEILRVRSEANLELRHREDELMRKFQAEQDRYEAESIRQKQAMVHEFNRATDALTDKISALNIALQEADERFERRESRPEDLDAINQLKDMVREREAHMQKLLDDKKFFQMELVNRETNFNKVFNTAPNVGVLNPRNKKKKGTAATAPPRFSSQFVSVPNLSSLEPALTGPNRLEPLRAGSNSPNGYNKPLQPTPPHHPKKFLR
ncbi:unnamed protein product [Clavelina lepadiformis]|uniref:Protein FAM184A/B N-terminal domain-containing protein n=1 Tax=Clavelina lepadiformis TaxID=159417 RepID=A0ABP0FN65_CLALP